MRRAQSLRTHNFRPSIGSGSGSSSGADDLGVLREAAEESPEGIMALQMVAAERENDKLKAQVLQLQDALSQRPPIEHIQELEREYKNLELILIGTQRENERCMAELERVKDREKMLERELQKLAGDNWQTSLNIPASTTLSSRSFTRPAGGIGIGIGSVLSAGDMSSMSSIFIPQAESTSLNDEENASASTTTNISFLSSPVKGSRKERVAESVEIDGEAEGRDSASVSMQMQQQQGSASAQTALAHIAQVRALILGMEERMQERESRLAAEVARAEGETHRFEAVRKEVDGVS